MNRRSMLLTSAAATVGGFVGKLGDSKLLSKEESITGIGTYSCLVKHGQMKTNDMFSWSLLNVDSSLDEERLNVERLKNDFGYKTELKYASNDAYKERVAMAFIDYFLQSKMSIKMLLFKVDKGGMKGQSPSKSFDDEIKRYQMISDLKLSSPNLVMKVENQFGPSKSFKTQLFNSCGISTVLGQSKLDVLIQMNDLISGIAHGIVANGNVKSEVRIKINNYFKEKVEIKVQGNLTYIGNNIIIESVSV